MRQIIRAAAVLAVTIAGAGCARPRQAGPAETPRHAALVEFTGTVDPLAGRLTLTANGAAGAARILAVIPVVQDGVPGSGPADTVELVTAGAATTENGCGADWSLDGTVDLRSFFAASALRGVYVEITRIDTGREACNSAPATGGLSDQYGLFSYGDLAPLGVATALWRFRLPTTAPFTFTGRVVADIVDGLAPVTRADPPGGLYDGAVSVTLACSDGGSGCAATYYTTDGSDPTTASSRYVGAVTVAEALTLRYFSVDAAGNAEPPRLDAYVLDTTAPTVTEVAPRRQEGDVATAAVVEVRFSEPMAPATVQGALSLVGPVGPVAGQVGQVDGTRWRFTPAAPLDAATSYAVAVSGAARDLAGNAVAAFSSRFSTATPVLAVSGAGSAPYRALSIAYDAQGNGVALFCTSSAASGRAGKLLYASYDAASDAWSAEHVLATDLSAGVVFLPARVVSNGATFLAVWQVRAGPIRAALITGGLAGPVTELAPNGNLTYPPPTFDVAANGARYAAVFVDGAVLKMRTHDGAAWDAAGATTLSETYQAINPVIAPRGSSWVAAWGEGNYALRTGSYDAASRTWTTAQLPGASGSAYIVAPAIASNGSTVVVGWGTTTGPVMASTDTGAGFGAAVNVSNGSGDGAYALSAAANGGRFAIAWRDRYSGGASAYGALFDGSAWSGASQLEWRNGAVKNVRVAPSGTGFAAAMEIADTTASGSPSSIWMNPTTSGGYWSSINQTQVESLATHATDLVVAQRGPGVALAWTQDDGTRHQVRLVSHGAAGFGATVPLANPGQPGGSGDVRLASGGAGDVAAVWTQDHRGARAVFAALRSGGTWSAPVLISLSADSPAVASNGVGFMIAYVERDVTGAALGVRVVAFVNGVPGAVTSFDCGGYAAPQPVLASDGSGYVVAWRYGVSAAGLRAAIRPAATTTWESPRDLAVSSVSAVAVAGRPGAYMVTWREDSRLMARGVTAPAPQGPWTWDAAAAWLGYSASQALAANPSAFGLAWYDSASLPAGPRVAVHVAGSWQPAASAGASPPYCTRVQLGASATGFLALAGCTDGLRETSYRGSWTTPALVGAPTTALAISSDGEGYKILTRPTDGTGTSLSAIDVASDGTVWPARALATGTQPSLSAAFDGTQHVAAWLEEGSDPTIDVVRARAGY